MNKKINNSEEELEILRKIEENPNLTQRQIADHLGLSLGKKSFNDEKLIKNFNAILETLEKEKSNNTVKGDLIKSAFITSTMGVSYRLKLGKNI